MKKIKNLFAAFTITALALTSCSSDDNGASTEASIVGKWTPTKTVSVTGTANTSIPYTDNEPNCDKDYIEFASGGGFSRVTYFKDGDNNCTQQSATAQTYTKTNSALTISGGLYAGTFEVTKLSSSELRLKQQSTSGGVTTTNTINFSKVQ